MLQSSCKVVPAAMLGRPLQEVVGTAGLYLCNWIQRPQLYSVGVVQPVRRRCRRRLSPRVAQDAALGKGLDVGGGEGCAVRSVGGMEEGVLADGGLEDEERPGQASIVVPLRPAAQEVAAPGLQAGGDAPRRRGPPLELQQVRTPPAPGGGTSPGTGARRCRGRVMRRDGRRRPPRPSGGSAAPATPWTPGRRARSPRASRSRGTRQPRQCHGPSGGTSGSTADGRCRDSPSRRCRRQAGRSGLGEPWRAARPGCLPTLLSR